jgi:hypothetical protein
MNNLQKRAGQSTRDMARKRYKNRVRFILITAGIALLIIIISYNSNLLGIGGLGSLGLLLLARLVIDFGDTKAKRMMKEEHRALRGARGEESIGSILDNLGEDHLIIHDIESPYGNIDHIVISKQSGIFLIETKAHGGRVSVNNSQLFVNGRQPEKDFIAQALNNAYWLRENISNKFGIKIWITPILVFTNAFVERTAPVKGVMIINKKFLLSVLQRPNIKAQNSAVWEQRENISANL